MHDFIDKEFGKAIPYSVYNIGANAGCVGVVHDTTEFAVNASRPWLAVMGHERHPTCDRLMFTADGGGANGSHVRLWKIRFCRKFLPRFGMGYDHWQRSGLKSAMIDFRGSHFEREFILWGVRWYVAYPISYWQLAEMTEVRGGVVDHSTLNRWLVKYVPELNRQFRSRKRPVGSSWRSDATYVKIRGSRELLYRAVDKAAASVDFLLTAKRDRNAAFQFLQRVIGQNGTPKKFTIGKSGANTTAIESYNAKHETNVENPHIKYLDNIVEQNHRAITRLVRQMLGIKSFRWGTATLAGVRFMHMIRKGQLQAMGKLRPAEQFYALAA